MKHYETILVIEDEDTVPPSAKNVRVHTIGAYGPIHYGPEVVVSYDAIEAFPEDFEWDRLDDGYFGNFPEVERRLEELRPFKNYQVTVTLHITVQAKNEDDALDEASNAYSLHHLFGGSVYVDENEVEEA